MHPFGMHKGWLLGLPQPYLFKLGVVVERQHITRFGAFANHVLCWDVCPARGSYYNIYHCQALEIPKASIKHSLSNLQTQSKKIFSQSRNLTWNNSAESGSRFDLFDLLESSN